MMTQTRLKELLHYSPETGVFTWLVNRKRGKAGCPAGHIEPNGYLSIGIDGERYGAHRLAWLYVHGSLPKQEIDHINRFRADNKIENLRESTPAENIYNRGVSRKNTSGYKGVTRSLKRWMALIKVAGKSIYLGTYTTKQEAAQAYNAAARKYFGDFAYQNPVEEIKNEGDSQTD
jgi:hypothetical protein